MKKLTKFLRPVALLVVGSALVSCGSTVTMLHNDLVSAGGYEYIVTAQMNVYSCTQFGSAGNVNSSYPGRYIFAHASGNQRQSTMSLAIRKCENKSAELPPSFGRVWFDSPLCMVTFVNGEDICDSQIASYQARKANLDSERRQQIVQAQQQRQQQATSAIRESCKSFGFIENTPEIANCILQLTVAQEGGQATASQTTSNSGAAALERQRSLNNAIQLLNQGLNILNGPAPTSNIPTSVSCRRMGDRSGQVYTFSRIGCPIGYAPAL